MNNIPLTFTVVETDSEIGLSIKLIQEGYLELSRNTI